MYTLPLEFAARQDRRVEFDLLKSLAENSIIAGFGYMMFQLMRRDHADTLRREQQHIAEVGALLKEAFDTQRRVIEAETRNERQLHEVKNAMQRLTFAVERLHVGLTGKPIEDK